MTRLKPGSLGVAGLSLFLSACVAGGASVSSPNFRISYNEITREQALLVSEEAERAYSQISRFIGASVAEPIEIRIRNFSDTDLAQAVHAKTLIEISSQRIGRPEQTSFVIHEVAHIVAGQAFSGSNILTEGFAMFAEDRFAPDPESAVRRAREPHRTARQVLKNNLYIPLERLHNEQFMFAPSAENTSAHRDRVVAYVQSGSFVKYLIDLYGIEKFLETYYRVPLSVAYGKSLGDLEKEWLAFLNKSGE